MGLNNNDTVTNKRLIRRIWELKNINQHLSVEDQKYIKKVRVKKQILDENEKRHGNFFFLGFLTSDNIIHDVIYNIHNNRSRFTRIIR